VIDNLGAVDATLVSFEDVNSERVCSQPGLRCLLPAPAIAALVCCSTLSNGLSRLACAAGSSVDQGTASL
jgi:hypothetical protein